MASARAVEAAPAEPPDLRLVLVGAAAWAGGLAGFRLPAGVLAVLAGSVALVALVLILHIVLAVRARPDGSGRGPWPAVRCEAADRRLTGALLACACAALAVAGTASVRLDVHRGSALAALAKDRAAVVAVVRVRSDPVPREGRFGPYVLARATVTSFTARGRTVVAALPVLVVGPTSWSAVRLGAVVEVRGRLAPADGHDLVAVLRTGAEPVRQRDPPPGFGAAEAVRESIRTAVAGSSPSARALVPALVVGDDAGMPERVVAEFRTAGLTHLTAVSGTNLTLVVGSLLLLARWAGVRSRGLLVVGLAGVVGFVLLARLEPSVLRAAAMGSVVLLGMGAGGRAGGGRALGAAVLLLLLIDPWLALSVGFALSALATAGILFVAPPLRDALVGWLPRWAAEAVAVTFSAQLVVTPLVAAVAGEVSLVAVAANLAAAPAVAPATVLGLAAGLVGLLSADTGRWLGLVAGWCADWIIEVAGAAAGQPGAGVPWPREASWALLLVVACLVVATLAARLLSRPRGALVVVALLVVVVARPLPGPAWPPSGWVMVACDVGQGDGLVLRAGPRSAVVVDTGPDPAVIDRCLRRLGVDNVPLAVLTHFHADHVAGLAGVVAGRGIGEVLVSPRADPAEPAKEVAALAARAGAPLREAAAGEVGQVGDVGYRVLAPAGPVVPGGGDAANNASLVLLAEIGGVRMLLTGDIEPEGQRALARSVGELRVDVLKVPHHGSRHQDLRLLTSLGAGLAIISAGADNDYGHPARETVDALTASGMRVVSTSRARDIAVVVRDGVAGVVRRRAGAA